MKYALGVGVLFEVADPTEDNVNFVLFCLCSIEMATKFSLRFGSSLSDRTFL